MLLKDKKRSLKYLVLVPSGQKTFWLCCLSFSVYKKKHFNKFYLNFLRY